MALPPSLCQSALDRLEVGLCLFDSHHQLIYINASAHNLLETDRKLLERKITLTEFISQFQLPFPLKEKPDFQQFTCNWTNASGVPIEIQYRNNGGELIQLSLNNLSDQQEMRRQLNEMAHWVERYQLAFNGANDGLWDWDIEKDEIYVSSRMEEILGNPLPGSTLNSRQLFSYFHKEDRIPLSNAILSLCKRETDHLEFEYRVITQDGTIRWLLDRGIAKFDETGRAYRIAGSVTDITERKLAAEQIKSSENQFRALYNESPLSIQVFAPNGTPVDVNKAWEKLWGTTKERLLASDYNILQDPQLKSHGVFDHIQRGFKGETIKIPPVEYRIPDRTSTQGGQKRWIQSFIYPIPDPQDRVKEVILIQEDITRQVLADQVIRHQANHDSLTELPNRALFFDRLTQALRKALRNNSKVALLFLDLDGFKNINDTYSHDTGDQVLKEAASRMQSAVRDSDTVARLAGDEFTIILPEIKNAVDVHPVLTKLVTLFSKPATCNHRNIALAVSIGIAIYPDNAENPDELLRCADAAMYEAKKERGTSYHFFTRQMDESAHLRMALEEELSLAISEQQLSLYFQPILDIQSNKLCGAETLIRWQHPRRGMVAPDLFIPIAEDSDLIFKIGQWVIDQACKHYRLWLKHELIPEGFRLAINLSTKQLLPQLSTILERSLKQHQLEPRFLILEITESMVVEEVGQVKQTLETLNNAGYRIALDDFGTGYSSLSYLHHLPVNTLKIDKSFVRELENTPDAQVLVKAIMAMAHNLGLKVVAEGIESKPELKFLKDIGCDYGQGYYLSRPLPNSEFIVLLNKNATNTFFC